MEKTLNLDNPEDFDALITALRAAGLDAYAWESGGGIRFVCVDLPTADGSWKAVAAGSNWAPCEIGTLDEKAASPEVWERVLSAPDALRAFMDHTRFGRAPSESPPIP